MNRQDLFPNSVFALVVKELSTCHVLLNQENVTKFQISNFLHAILERQINNDSNDHPAARGIFEINQALKFGVRL
tara:strand:- start:283 stop:507 length:225 start_codon:yes stop_codon:yes gene_type:complete